MSFKIRLTILELCHETKNVIFQFHLCRQNHDFNVEEIYTNRQSGVVVSVLALHSSVGFCTTHKVLSGFI